MICNIFISLFTQIQLSSFNEVNSGQRSSGKATGAIFVTIVLLAVASGFGYFGFKKYQAGEFILYNPISRRFLQEDSKILVNNEVCDTIPEDDAEATSEPIGGETIQSTYQRNKFNYEPMTD